MTKEEPKQIKQWCYTCKHWGEGKGTGMPYDAGHMHYCNHEGINGLQHPSFGACGERKTLLYVEGLLDRKVGDKLHRPHQHIMTRGIFGCNQWQHNGLKK